MLRPTRPFLLLATLGALGAAPAEAQSGAGAWAPWLGCWVTEGAPADAPLTCVVPATGRGAVDLVTVTAGAVTRRTGIVADGTRREVDAAGCRGWESARFSLDGDRVYLTAEVTCDGRPAQATSGILSITSAGHFLDVQGVRVGAQQNLRISRLIPATDLSRLPEDLRTAIGALPRAAGDARVAAGALPTFADVRDVVEAADPGTAEAWLVATHRDAASTFTPTARDLVALEDAGVPARVIDVIVALGYPERFQVAVGPAGVGSIARAEPPVADRRALGGGGAPAFDQSPWFYGGYGWFTPNCAFAFGPGSVSFDARRYNACSPLGYLPLYGPSWAFGGWGSWPGWTFGSPITVVVRPQKPTDGGGAPPQPARRGRVVRGGGYTQEGGTPSGEPAKPRTETATRAGGMGAGSDGGAGSRGSSTGGAPAGGSTSGSSSGSSGRTAKPRKP